MTLVILNVYVPDRITYILIKLRFCAFDFLWLDFVKFNPFEDGRLQDISFTQPSHGLEDLKFTNGSFSILYFQITKAVMWIFVLHLLALPIILTSEFMKKIRWLKGIAVWLNKFFHAAVYLRLFQVSFLYLFMNCFAEVALGFNDSDNQVSYWISVGLLALICILVSMIPIHILSFYNPQTNLQKGLPSMFYVGRKSIGDEEENVRLYIGSQLTIFLFF